MLHDSIHLLLEKVKRVAVLLHLLQMLQIRVVGWNRQKLLTLSPNYRQKKVVDLEMSKKSNQIIQRVVAVAVAVAAPPSPFFSCP